VTLALVLLVAAVAAVAAAYEVHGPADGGSTPIVGRILRRFDLTVLAVMVLFLALRTASRIEADHTAGWMPAFFAVGGSRRAYGAGIAASSLIGPGAIFLAAAVAFAASVTMLTGSSELLRELPVTAGAGLLLLGTYAALTAATGTLLRRAAAAWAVIGLFIAFPTILVLRYAAGEAAPPLWVLVVQLAAPPTFMPDDGTNALRAIVHILVTGSIALLVAHRQAGRTT
jgi:hypothetical protein